METLFEFAAANPFMTTALLMTPLAIAAAIGLVELWENWEDDED